MIYFLQLQGDDNPVKIGWTSNLESRLRHLNPGHPSGVKVIRTLDGKRWVESWLHGAFANSRRHGEWFNFHPDMLTIEPPSEKPLRNAKTLDETSRIIPVRLDRNMLVELQKQAKADDRTLVSVIYLAVAEWLGKPPPSSLMAVRDATRRGEEPKPTFPHRIRKSELEPAA